MKKIITTLVVLISISTFSQSIMNELSTADYESIKFNGVLKTTLESIDADLTLLESSFGAVDTIASDDEGVDEGWKTYTFTNFIIGYNNTNVAGESFISYIQATSISLNGVTVAIGDDVSLLGNLLINTTANGSNIQLIHLNGDCCPVIISLDSDNKITKIEYFVWT